MQRWCLSEPIWLHNRHNYVHPTRSGLMRLFCLLAGREGFTWSMPNPLEQRVRAAGQKKYAHMLCMGWAMDGLVVKKPQDWLPQSYCWYRKMLNIKLGVIDWQYIPT